MTISTKKKWYQYEYKEGDNGFWIAAAICWPTAILLLIAFKIGGY